MKPKIVAAALFALAAQSSSAAIINLQMGNFSFPIWNETKTEIIGQDVGGSLELMIDDSIMDGDSHEWRGHFAGAIVGGRCTDGFTNIEFNLDASSISEVRTQFGGYANIGFSANMKDAQGNAALFELWMEGNFAETVGHSLANIDYVANTWRDSIFLTLTGNTTFFMGAFPHELSVGGNEVPEPKGVILFMLGLAALHQSRKKWRSVIPS